MNRLFFVLMLIISGVLFVCAPEQYSFNFCFLLHNLFIAEAIILFVIDKKNEKVGFNLLFSISYFFTSFAYPIYIYPINPSYSLFAFPFDTDVITRCTALALFAYSSYAFGYVRRLKYCNQLSFQLSIRTISLVRYELLFVVYVIMFILCGGGDYYEDRYVRSQMSVNYVVQYLMVFFNSIVIVFSCFIFLIKRSSYVKSIYVLLILVAILLMSYGTRTVPLIIVSALFIIYNIKHNINLKYVLGGIVIGTFLLSFIGATRNGDVADHSQSQIGVIEIFSDLVINNRNLYVLYDFVEKNTYTFGLSLVGPLLSPVPFAQSLFGNVTGVPAYLLDSASFSTFLQFGASPPMGLGTHIVGDVYLAFGLLGVLMLFYLLGHFVVYSRTQMRRGSVLYMVIYLVLASDAIFMCRASFFDAFRTLIWTPLFIMLLFRGKSILINK